MRTGLALVVLLAVCAAAAAADGQAPAEVGIAEVVADPHTDWNGDDKITPSDEFVELHNTGDVTADLAGWLLLLEDTTPDEAALVGTVAPGARVVVWNPPGALNNDAVVRLVDADGAERDRVAYGSYDPTGSVPDADAADRRDEALAWNGTAWIRAHATPGSHSDQAHWTVAHLFDARADGWYAPPNATRDVEVVLVHGHRAIANVTLDANPPVTVEGAPGYVVEATFRLEAGPAGARDVVLRFAVDGAVRSATVGRLVVDGQPPTTPAPSAPVWASGDAFVVAWDPSVDAGIGGVWYEAEIEREENGSRRVQRVEIVQPQVRVGSLVDGQVVDVRVRAVDAYANAGNWSQTTRTRIDQSPPARPESLAVDGATETRLSWSAALDLGAGVDRYEVQRVWDGIVDGFDAGATTTWTDPDGPTGGNLSYRVRAVDKAENAGAWNQTVADHPALHPAVAGIRVGKPLWSGGVQEVRVDFDRPMDTARPPQVASDVAWVEARWFANASTYYLKASGPDAAAEGDHVVQVAAWAADGRGLRAPAEAAFRVDTVAPTTRFDEAAARFEVQDAQDAAPRLFVKRWAAGGQVPAAYVLWDPERNATADLDPGRWRFRFFALDDAGNKEAVQETVVGVDPTSDPAPSPPGTSASPDPRPSPAPPAAPPSPAVVPPAPTTSGEAGGLADVEAQRQDLAAPEAGGSTWVWWGLALGGVSASGGVFAWRRDWVGGALRRWRDWRRPDSLAVRVRRWRRKG